MPRSPHNRATGTGFLFTVKKNLWSLLLLFYFVIIIQMWYAAVSFAPYVAAVGIMAALTSNPQVSSTVIPPLHSRDPQGWTAF